MSLALLTAALVASAQPFNASDAATSPRSALIVEDARPLARASWNLRRGRSDAALRALDGLETALFADRAALLRGQALEARRELDGARAAYAEALRLAASGGVAEEALRGAISVAGRRRDWRAQLEHLDALAAREAFDGVSSPWPRARGALADPELELLRVAALAKLGRRAEARERAWSVLDEHPSPRIVDAARRALLAIDNRRRLRREESARIELARARALARAGRHAAAARALRGLRNERSLRDLALTIDLELAAVYRARSDRHRAQQLLDRWNTRRDLGDARAPVVLALARIAVDRHQFARARQIFAEVTASFPRTTASAEAAFEAAILDYDDGEHARAAEAMRALAESDPTGPLAERAWWMAGWSAYLAARDALAPPGGPVSTALEAASTPAACPPEACAAIDTALTAFQRLLESSDLELREAAAYWLARTHERAGELAAAVETYRALVAIAPLRYHGLLARDRRVLLGEAPWIAPVPAAPAPTSAEELASRLGPERPINFDRAVALFRADLRADGVDELLTAIDTYRAGGDVTGAALSIEVFRIFDRKPWAALVARRLAEESTVSPVEDAELRRVWSYAYPTPFREEVEKASRDHDVDPFLAYAVMRTESRYRPDAVSPAGARGLMQIMPATARWIARTAPAARRHAARYRAPGPNIWLGAWYVRNLIDRYDGNLVQALGAYNAGPGAVDRWARRFAPLARDELAERIPYSETRGYVRRTVESYLVYHALNDARGPSAEAPGG